MLDLSELPFSYSRGNNPYTDDATYYCGSCGLDIQGDEVGYVAAGTNYANGEFAPCPACGEEHEVFRGEDPESVVHEPAVKPKTRKKKEEVFEFSQQEVEDIVRKQLLSEGIKIKKIIFKDHDHFEKIGRLGMRIWYKE